MTEDKHDMAVSALHQIARGGGGMAKYMHKHVLEIITLLIRRNTHDFFSLFKVARGNFPGGKLFQKRSAPENVCLSALQVSTRC